MKKIYDLKLDYNLISNRKSVKGVLFLDQIEGCFKKNSKEFKGKKVKLIIGERDFSLLESRLLNALKKVKAKTTVLVVDNKSDLSFEASKTDRVVAVGDNLLLSKVRLSYISVDCYAIPTTPYIEELFIDKVYIQEGITKSYSVKGFKRVFIDEDIILTAYKRYFANGYISVMSKLTALLDYKINCFLSGENVDGEVFSLTKRAINLLARIGEYENYQSVILGAQLILSSLGDVNPFEGSGVDVVKNALGVYASDLLLGQRILSAFEKSAKIYHLYFSNDFSNLLSVPDYYSDVQELEKDVGLDKEFFYSNLKIPSEKRIKLINALILKVRDDFKRETSVILSVLPTVIKIYKQIYNKDQKPLSYKQIKNAVTKGSYLSSKTSILTLCRDQGILKCAN